MFADCEVAEVVKLVHIATVTLKYSTQMYGLLALS
jgi:hypothetical protein